MARRSSPTPYRYAPPTARPRADADARVWAVLGPTNTGKTHLAIERLLGHETGIIGLPLRLLAREVYDKVKRRAGAAHTALVTGEEKIVPAHPRYWVTTVESMPVGLSVDFVAVDEVQLAADRERGHVFTHRLMHMRGDLETLFLGAGTIKTRLQNVVPGCRIDHRPRFSELSYAGAKKLTRLPRRSAVVAFSADEVYAVAELIRRHRGGAAVVMGALSPRTRNAQVALYQSGDVDFIVATDAIGMGLNMDVDHVAFASVNKFDGRHHRRLTSAEIGQIAGRAGRYTEDGTFGVTGQAPPLDDGQVRDIEDHEFEPVKTMMWRNTQLDFASIDTLLASLAVAPPARALTRTRTATDVAALTLMAGDARVQPLAKGQDAVARLWDVAQVPDFRKMMIDEHARLLADIYQHLMSAHGAHVIPEDWFAHQTRLTDRADGDIDTLASRLAHIRTWTYVANRADWLADPAYWQGVTRAIEDRLSDALHARLTQQFIDRRTSVLLKRLQQSEDLMTAVNAQGEVTVEGAFVGRLAGLVFVPDPRAEGMDSKALRAASDKAVTGEIDARAQRLVAAADDAFHLTEHGRIVWEASPVGRLRAGQDRLSPRVDVIAGDELQTAQRLAVTRRLDAWLEAHIARTLEPLVKLRDAQDVTGLARGVGYRLIEALGTLRREDVADDIAALAQPDRAMLRKYGVRFGAFSIFMPALLKPAPAHLILLLHAVYAAAGSPVDVPAPPAPGLTSTAVEPGVPAFFYPALGFRVCGPRAVRLDMLERLADAIRTKISARAQLGQGYGGAGFLADADLMSLVGCSGDAFEGLIGSLGFQPHKVRVLKIPSPSLTPPATPPAAPTEAAAIEADTRAPAPSDEPAAPDATPAADAQTAPVDATNPAPDAQDPPVVADAAVEEDAAPEDAAKKRAAEDGAVEDGAAAGDEMEEIVLWRPARKARRAQPRHDAPAGAKRKPASKHDRPAKTAKPHRSRKPKTPSTTPPRPRQPERPADPDSPFAVLGQLKSKS